MKERKRNEPWKALGLTRSTFYYRIRKGKLSANYLNRQNGKRFSGQSYENSTEKLMAIREKYKNGVNKEIIEEMMEVKL